MEEGKKKIVMIVIIVVCLAAAGIITYRTQQKRSSEGLGAIKKGTEKVWLKCRNPDCENAWQMDMREYFEYLNEHRVTMQVPPVVCPKCGEESGYRAEKCPSCDFVFERGSVPDDYVDRCPKCGYSATEEKRKKRQEAREAREKEEE